MLVFLFENKGFHSHSFPCHRFTMLIFALNLLRFNNFSGKPQASSGRCSPQTMDNRSHTTSNPHGFATSYLIFATVSSDFVIRSGTLFHLKLPVAIYKCCFSFFTNPPYRNPKPFCTVQAHNRMSICFPFHLL